MIHCAKIFASRLVFLVISSYLQAFGEGNTRTIAIFTIKYLRSLGFSVNNDMFEHYSWYFRNALVRANYRNVRKGINAEPLFLIRFFRNLLLGENNELKNRYMLVNPPEEWKTRTSTEQVPEQVRDLLHTNNPLIIELIKVIGNEELSVSQLMERIELKHRPNFIEYHLNPAISEGYVRLLYPDKPHHPRQRYLLTLKGQMLYQELCD